MLATNAAIVYCGQVNAPASACSPRFSLILATLGRTQQLERFLRALDAQTWRDFELIVVDQNADDRLVAMLARYAAAFPVIHLRSPPGLSRARNAGLGCAKGEIAGFPDDDCWYPEDLLARVATWFDAHPRYDGVTGRAVDEAGDASTAPALGRAGPVKRNTVWKQGVSISIFLRRSVIGSVGGFNEELGVGSGTRWGSGEETDYLLRALGHGFRLWYDPTLTVGHPSVMAADAERSTRRARLYGGGMGRVMRMHRFPPWFVLYQLLRPLLGCAWATLRLDLDRSRFYLASFRARADGWRS